MPRFALTHDPSAARRKWKLDLRSIGLGRPGFETKAQATVYADKKQTELENLGSSALTITHADRLNLEYAKQKLDPFGVTVKEAVDYYAVHHVARQARTVAQVAAEMAIAKKAAGVRDTSLKTLASHLRSFAEATDGKALAQIETSDIEAWLAAPGKRTKKPPSFFSRRSMLIDLRTMFQFAIKRNYCVRDPSQNVEKVKTEDPPRGILSVEQCKAFLGAALRTDPTMVRFLVVQIFGGLRPSEAERLTNADVLKTVINVSAKSKGRRRRLVTINPTLRAWLKIPGTLPPTDWENRRKALRKLANIPWPRDCMRHTAASMMVAEFGGAKASNELGHSEAILFKHYRELVTAEQVKAFWALRPNRLPVPESEEMSDEEFEDMTGEDPATSNNSSEPRAKKR